MWNFNDLSNCEWKLNGKNVPKHQNFTSIACLQHLASTIRKLKKWYFSNWIAEGLNIRLVLI